MATPPVPSSDFDVARENLNTLDELINTPSGTTTNREGQELTVIPQLIGNLETLASGELTLYWRRLPSVYKIILSGVGVVEIQARDFFEELTQTTTYSVNGYQEVFTIFEGAYEIRAVVSGSARAEVV